MVYYLSSLGANNITFLNFQSYFQVFYCISNTLRVSLELYVIFHLNFSRKTLGIKCISMLLIWFMHLKWFSPDTDLANVSQASMNRTTTRSKRFACSSLTFGAQHPEATKAHCGYTLYRILYRVPSLCPPCTQSPLEQTMGECTKNEKVQMQT